MLNDPFVGLPNAAHPIDLTDPIHTWQEVAHIITIRDGKSYAVWRCTGCPQERWVPK